MKEDCINIDNYYLQDRQEMALYIYFDYHALLLFLRYIS